MDQQQQLVVYYRKQKTLNQKCIVIPQDPCPSSYILEQIIKQEDLVRITQKPQLFYENFGNKIGDTDVVPKNSRLEYNVIVPAGTVVGGPPGGAGGQSHGGHHHNYHGGQHHGGGSHHHRGGDNDHRMGGHDRSGRGSGMHSGQRDHGSGATGSGDVTNSQATTQASGHGGSGTEFSGASHSGQGGGGGGHHHGYSGHHGGGHMDGRHSRGGHHGGGKYGPGGVSHFYTSSGGQVLSPHFVCDRCKTPGHYIRDCPQNGNPLYNPSQRKGIPTTQLWRGMIAAEEFERDRNLVHKSLMKQGNIYDFSERIVPKDANPESDSKKEAEAKVQAETNDDANTASGSKPSGGASKNGLTDLPPSLKCMLCKDLIEFATLTPCCFSSCCYECLKSYLTSSHKLASSRAGVCPIAHCREQDVFVQDLIPNQALNKAAEWFVRQRLSLTDEVELEVAREGKPAEVDVVTLGHKLIEDAKMQAEAVDAPIVPPNKAQEGGALPGLFGAAGVIDQDIVMSSAVVGDQVDLANLGQQATGKNSTATLAKKADDTGMIGAFPGQKSGSSGTTNVAAVGQQNNLGQGNPLIAQQAQQQQQAQQHQQALLMAAQASASNQHNSAQQQMIMRLFQQLQQQQRHPQQNTNPQQAQQIQYHLALLAQQQQQQQQQFQKASKQQQNPSK